MPHSLHLHPDLRCQVVPVGRERQPVVVIENVFAEPERLVEIAAGGTFGPPEEIFYPGLRTPAPPEYCEAIRHFLADMLRRVFGLGAMRVVSSRSDYSLVTVRPEDLKPQQSIPHYDGCDSEVIAGVHYLCGAEYGGTSFYHHRRTGFESVDQKRLDTYRQMLDKEFASLGLPSPSYISGDTVQFLRTASVNAAFNRAIFYRGIMLHSGDVGANFRPDADPRTGRLTLNSFLRFGSLPA